MAARFCAGSRAGSRVRAKYIPTGGAAPDADSAPRAPSSASAGRLPAPNAGPDDVTLRVNGEDFVGWQGVRVTRRLLSSKG